jgi:hypothetical protein
VKIHTMPQGSVEWHEVRARNFTASELGEWALEPVRNTMTVEEIKTELDTLGINRGKFTKRDDLLSMLPDLPEYKTLADGARTAILRKIKQEKLAAIRSRQSITSEDSVFLQREDELQAASDRSFAYNIPVKYGKLLEPFAREYYEQATGFEVTECGFVEADSGGFGCSPDGLIYLFTGCQNYPNKPTHGVEIKCPIPETHLAWLLDGGLPDCHRLQVHASMAVMGLDRYDFLSYCPGDAPLLVTVERDETTERLERGLKTLVTEKAKIKAQLAMLWRNAYEP